MSEGRAHRFGDDVTTDDIIAGKYKHRTIDPDELARHAMENVRPGFATAVRPGDFVVAGRNFGCGSSREQAPQILLHLGISAVAATSFARIFFRNAINIGLLLLEVDTRGIVEGDIVSYDGEHLRVARRGIARRPVPIPADIRAIVDAGGLLAHVRAGGFG